MLLSWKIQHYRLRIPHSKYFNGNALYLDFYGFWNTLTFLLMTTLIYEKKCIFILKYYAHFKFRKYHKASWKCYYNYIVITMYPRSRSHTTLREFSTQMHTLSLEISIPHMVFRHFIFSGFKWLQRLICDSCAKFRLQISLSWLSLVHLSLTDATIHSSMFAKTYIISKTA